jgi:hypothetical protein
MLSALENFCPKDTFDPDAPVPTHQGWITQLVPAILSSFIDNTPFFHTLVPVAKLQVSHLFIFIKFLILITIREIK